MPSLRQPRIDNFIRVLTIIFAAISAAMATDHGARAWTLKTLYSFCAQPNCADGNLPAWVPLLIDQAGDLYGTTGLGGAGNRGTVFALLRDGDNWQWQMLYSFCGQANCADGASPGGNLIMDTAGNLYGMTQAGGSADGGAVYELSPNGDGNPWTERLLHLFCSLPACADGQGPTAAGLTYSGAATGAPFDGVSPLYGTTYNGGANLRGTAFELRLDPSGSKWREQVIYDFCPQQFCTDGMDPIGSLVLDGSRTLFGTTQNGGAAARGTVFELRRDRASKQWTEVVLTFLCRKYHCTAGSPSFGNLFRDAAGHLIGTTETWGSRCGQKALHACGMVFEIAPNGTASHFKRLYGFCSMPDCADGEIPTGSLVADKSGNLYGTTERGGANGSGTVFKLTGTALEVLYSFCAQPNCADGALPLSGVVLDASGNLFGTTSYRGANNGGTVFELSP